MTAMLAVMSVTVARGGVDVVRDVSLAIAPGDLIAVVGANGAGKSTLLKCLAGILAPRLGAVTWEGRAFADLSRRELAMRVAFLPQERVVHWALSAERVVALGRLPHRSFAAGESANDRAAIERAKRGMDVMQFAQRPIATLSGGEQARVLIARALAQDARVIVADEPTSGLDPAHALSVFEQFRAISGERRAVVTALHDLSLAARYANRVIVLKSGVCIADGQPAEVLSKTNLASAFNIDAYLTHVGDVPVIVPTSPLT